MLQKLWGRYYYVYYFVYYLSTMYYKYQVSTLGSWQLQEKGEPENPGQERRGEVGCGAAGDGTMNTSSKPWQIFRYLWFTSKSHIIAVISNVFWAWNQVVPSTISSKCVLSSSSPVQAPALCNLQGCFSILIGLLGLRQTSIDAGMPISRTRSACSTAATWSMHTITCTPKAVPERKRIVFQVMNEKKIERQMNEIQKKRKNFFSKTESKGQEAIK